MIYREDTWYQHSNSLVHQEQREKAQKMETFRSCLPLRETPNGTANTANESPRSSTSTHPSHLQAQIEELNIQSVEDYQDGYPQFTALISAHRPYFLCRRFGKLRARLLLLKQDRLSMIEQRLEQVDQEERSKLFLGKSRRDRNPERISLLSEADTLLADYGEYYYYQ
jgi:hypothetical protein